MAVFFAGRAGSRGLIAAAAFAVVATGSTGTSAQVVFTPTVQPGCTSSLDPTNVVAGPQTQILGGALGAANAISSVIGTINTSFLAQGNAFVAGLPNATPDETSGGIWGRTIGGRVSEQATGTFSGTVGPSAFAGTTATSGQVTCASNVRMDYGGFQMGQDIARLNIGGNGATFHFGVTGGYAEANAQDLAGSNFSGNFQVPFAGLYAAYTNGRFFADILGRVDFYQMNLFSPDASLSNQRLDAVGGTVAASTGYRFDLGNNWFFEPSASGIYSKVSIDTLNVPEGYGNSNNPFALPPATIQFGDNISILGRVGARVGTTIDSGSIVWQPFATASVWHEFAGNNTATYNAPAYPPGGTDFTVSGNLSTSRVGTYGQYSIGSAASFTGTPWLGYLRIDYKEGQNIEGLGFNAGLRYNFDPNAKGVVVPGIFKAQPRVVATAYDWTGFYLGGFVGAAAGHSNWNFPDIGIGSSHTTAGALGGVDVGYRKQYGSWVVGAEADVAAANAQGGTTCISNALNFGFPVETNCDNDVKWMATATAKLGYAWGAVLAYGKAGAAWTNNTLNVSCNGDANYQFNCTPANNLTTGISGVQNTLSSIGEFGWTIGAGFELGLTPNWSAKAEYDYMNFGSQAVTLPDTTRVNFKQDFSQVKIGLNYRFGPSGEDVAPVAMPTKAPPLPVVAYNWTGGYIGAAAADHWSASSWNTSAIGNGPGAGFLAPDPTTSYSSFFSAAAQGRIYGGYNWQFSPKWVAGVEADVGFGNSTMTRGGIPGTFGNGFNATNGAFPGTEAEGVDSSVVKMGWDSTVRAKLGMVVAPSLMVYGTAGVAFQQVSESASCDGSSNSWCQFTGIAKSQTFSSTLTGWTVGGGVEGVISGNWLGKIEVRYADLGHLNNTFFAGTGDDVITSLHVQTYTALAGVAYKFSQGVVVAKY
jgi:opacity protein-like surface antigen